MSKLDQRGNYGDLGNEVMMMTQVRNEETKELKKSNQFCISMNPEDRYSGPDVFPDLKTSPISGAQLTYPNNYPETFGGARESAIYTSTRGSQQTAGFDLLNGGSMYFLVKNRAKLLFEKLIPTDQIDYYPVDVVCRDGLTIRYLATRPLIRKNMVDREATDIVWYGPMQKIGSVQGQVRLKRQDFSEFEIMIDDLIPNLIISKHVASEISREFPNESEFLELESVEF